MSNTPLERVFVYGTLKRGFCNHDLLAKARFVDTPVTVKLYGFYADRDVYAADEEIPIPYLFHDPAPGDAAVAVQGEIYEVSPRTLARLDVLEGHPDWYERQRLPIQRPDGAVTECWGYFIPGPAKAGMRLLSSGLFEA